MVYIDTEGTFRPERIRQIAEAKGVSADAAMDNIVYVTWSAESEPRIAVKVVLLLSLTFPGPRQDATPQIIWSSCWWRQPA